ncbi:REDY-like protein HapK [Caulobacter sp. S45]|uniref:REDY-like protein HapK n=1 Tax=Caulobacter sp. S45 TaxID=1641861 RepID=UPI001576B4E2|nr:REDY-like protein HapK [Caulobacter sp. S45]
MRIVALFNLKPGVERERYERWARTTDMPTVKALASIADFQVLRTTGLLGSEAPAPYQYLEIIDVADPEQFSRDVATEAMTRVAQAFQELAEVTFMLTEPLAAEEPA